MGRFEDLDCGVFMVHRTDRGWTVSARPALEDRPGELADIAEDAAACGGNIEVFYFNRSEDSHGFDLRVSVPDEASLGPLLERLNHWTGPEKRERETAAVVDPAGLLSVTMTLEDRPGELARAAEVFKAHEANVLYMEYDGDNAPGMVRLSMAARSPEQVGAMLATLRQERFHHHVEWTGESMPSMDEVLGLNHVEAFLFQLRNVLPAGDFEDLSELIRSSDDLSRTLAEFRRESGGSDRSMAASEVFTNILQLAAASNTRTGPNFTLKLTGPMRITDRVAMYILACPTGANSYLFKADGELVLLDSSYGLYFDDVADWLGAHGMPPERIGRAYFTHADADHAGWAAPLQERFGTEIFMHADCRGVMDHENRGWGGDPRLKVLNGLYTTLINRFTAMRSVDSLTLFAQERRGESHGFPVVDSFMIGDVEFEVLESSGGHVPGQVFFLCREHGMLFSGDYLIDVPSLSDRTKSTLSLARFLITSTNVDSKEFVREMKDLQALMRQVEAEAPVPARVFPGHGDQYPVSEVEWGAEPSA